MTFPRCSCPYMPPRSSSEDSAPYGSHRAVSRPVLTPIAPPEHPRPPRYRLSGRCLFQPGQVGAHLLALGLLIVGSLAPSIFLLGFGQFRLDLLGHRRLTV